MMLNSLIQHSNQGITNCRLIQPSRIYGNVIATLIQSVQLFDGLFHGFRGEAVVDAKDTEDVLETVQGSFAYT